jgi:hypothetical protein
MCLHVKGQIEGLIMKWSIRWPMGDFLCIFSCDMKRHWLVETVKWEDSQWEILHAFSHDMKIQMHVLMSWIGKYTSSCDMKRQSLVKRNNFINYNLFSMMKITLNSITFALFVKNLQNDHHAHRFAKGFLLILKAKQGFMVHED